MTDLGVQDAAAKADHMVNPASLAASMIDERAPDIVEALNDTPPELAVAVLLHLPPDRAIEVLDQPGLEREPELVTLMPREAAARLLSLFGKHHHKGHKTRRCNTTLLPS